MTSSQFIRTQPLSISAADVVALGKKQGMEFSPNLVYAVRSKLREDRKDKHKARKRKAKLAKAPAPTARQESVAEILRDTEVRLRKAIVREVMGAVTAAASNSSKVA